MVVDTEAWEKMELDTLAMEEMEEMEFTGTFVVGTGAPQVIQLVIRKGEFFKGFLFV